MFAYKRLAQLFQRLYIEKNCSSEKLASDFSVSKRTIRNDIHELNESLETYHSKVILKRGVGYELLGKENVQALFNELNEQLPPVEQQLESSEDRIKQLLLLLLLSEQELSIDEMCNQIFVGRTTVLGYIRQLRLLLASYNLKITSKINIGYKVVGDESAIREVISDQLVEKNFESYISQFSKNESELFKDIDLEELAGSVTEYFPPDKYKISDYNRKNFVIHLAIAILRVKNDHHLDVIANHFMIDDGIQSATTTLLTAIEKKYQLSFDQQDRTWLYNHLFSDLQHKSYSSHQIEKIYTFIDQMLGEIYEIIGEDLKHDEILRNDLFTHFSSYLTLKELLKNKKNPLLPEIKKNFSYAFELAILATNNSKWLNDFEFTEDDIGYLALHIAAAIERKKDQQQNKKRILVVCGQGVSTSRLIEAMLKKRFAERFEIVDTISYTAYQTKELENVDLLISTVPLKDKTIPVVQIDFLDIKQGMEKIDRLLAAEDEKQTFFSLFDPTLFAVNNQKISRDHLITSLGAILLEQGIVSNDFTKKVIEREQIAPTNITKLIAIPHAIDSTINETKIFVYISTEPITWRENATVKIIFLLAVAEDDKEKLQTFFEFLSDLVEDEKLQQKIAATTNFDSFLAAMV
ncbi:BglG family transcription antiterminator [Candidatus Enterococcus murrayae]|uniref:Transcription antiterminator n=1 Tax=Candidatus Enterococcus murrayae TaxID=2815321 RepID=A0ABS3HEY9_9ENTE|nr:BglG family transcription antiterminator [Enterococcus sp. MJM16]MBO0452019.1 transcription antiterminator [Enterococcus sp. MJM16]